MNWSIQKRPLAGNHRKQIKARPISYKHEGKRLYAGTIDEREALFVGRLEGEVLCFELVTAA